MLLLIVLICSAIFTGSASAQTSGSASHCPISLDRLDLRYNHAGGQSVPQLKLAFVSRTERTVSYLNFAVTILDSQGNPHPYTQDLSYRHDIPPGSQQRSHTWNLDPAAVDMHHSGESITLLGAQFADGTAWKDDGSLACTLAVDFHPK